MNSMDIRGFHTLPLIFLTLTCFISLTPLPFGGNHLVMPAFTLVTVYFWSLIRPNLLPALAIAIAGLVLDAFTAPALGMYMLTLLMMRALAIRLSSRFARQTIWFFWAGFAALSLPCWIFFWILANQISAESTPFLPAMIQWAFTTLWYPLLHLVFTRSLSILPQYR